MIRNDKMQLFDFALAREIIAMNRDELWRFVQSREEELLAKSGRRSCFVLPPDRPVKTRTTEYVFNEFFKADHAEVRLMLISDLCYHGELFEIDYYARCGYFDDISSIYAQTPDEIDAGGAVSSDDLYQLPEESEAWDYVKRFDLIGAHHVELMSAALKKNREQLSADEYTTQLLMLRTMGQTLAADPDLRIAYFYQK